MEQFVQNISSFPTVIATVLLGIVVIYWLLAILGAVDVDVLDLDLDTEASSLGGITGFMSAVGLSGVPVTVILSLLILFTWLLSYFANAHLISLIPGEIPAYLLGTIILFACFVVSVFITGRVIKPMRGLFVTHTAKTKDQYLGATCKVTTGSVTEEFGQAEIEDGEAGIIISVRSMTPSTLKKGDKAVIMTYDKLSSTYEVIAEKDLLRD